MQLFWRTDWLVLVKVLQLAAFNSLKRYFNNNSKVAFILLTKLQDFGILPRIAKLLLEFKKQEPPNIKTCIQMSYGEFYKSQVIDLLKSDEVMVDISKCRGIKRVHVCNYLDAMKCIFLGKSQNSQNL